MKTPCECLNYTGRCSRIKQSINYRQWQLCSENCTPDAPCPSAEVRELILKTWTGEAGNGKVPAVIPDKELLACKGHGDPVIDPVTQLQLVTSCESCQGKTRFKVFRCTIKNADVTINDCRGCMLYEQLLQPAQVGV